MTNKYEVTPNPSQPNNNLIRLGLRISKNIDMIKKNTSIMNREKNFSFIIYLLLNSITLPEINLTRLTKYKDIISTIKTKLIMIEPNFTTSHSKINSVLLDLIIQYIKI